eukprot:gene12771-26929_t
MMLDLTKLDRMVAKRSLTRDRLEKAIAIKCATGVSPTTYKLQPTYEIYYYDIEQTDAIQYYTELLDELNKNVSELQVFYREKITDAKPKVQKLSDTRITVAAKHMAEHGSNMVKDIKELNTTVLADLKQLDVNNVFNDVNNALKRGSSMGLNVTTTSNSNTHNINDNSSNGKASGSGSGKASGSLSAICALSHVNMEDSSNGDSNGNDVKKIHNGVEVEEEEEYAAEPDPRPNPTAHHHTSVSVNGPPMRGRAVSMQEVREIELEMEREIMLEQRRRLKLHKKGGGENEIGGKDHDGEEEDGDGGYTSDDHGHGVDVAKNPLHQIQEDEENSPCSPQQHQQQHHHKKRHHSSLSNKDEIEKEPQDGSTNTNNNNNNVLFLSTSSAAVNVGASAAMLSELAKERATNMTKEGFNAARSAGKGALKGIMEMEKHLELATLGAYFKTSSTAFVTFRNRTSRSIAHQITLSHDNMKISTAPDPKDILWDNVSTPFTQISTRHIVANIACIFGALFWSSVVALIYKIANAFSKDDTLSQYVAVLILVSFLCSLPVVFDIIARYYEGMKLESEVQNSIMARYFYYQLANVYVTIAFGSLDASQQLTQQVFNSVTDPTMLVNLLGTSLPGVSLFFVNLIIAKTFLAIPLEMLRVYYLFYILG